MDLVCTLNLVLCINEKHQIAYLFLSGFSSGQASWAKSKSWRVCLKFFDALLGGIAVGAKLFLCCLGLVSPFSLAESDALICLHKFAPWCKVQN